jgi:putative FmdB family regulatory protein
MPTYEYRCKGCEREFEVQQKMSDPDLVTCEACGADKLEKLISWTSVGSDGWKAALRANNPKEAFKGIHAVDRSTNRTRFKGNATSDDDAAPDEPQAATPAPSDDTTT